MIDLVSPLGSRMWSNAAVVVSSLICGAAAATGHLKWLIAIAFLTVFVTCPTSVRLGILLAMLAGNVGYWLGLPSGSFVLLIVLAVFRDVVRPHRMAVDANAIAWWMVCCTFVLGFNPDHFGLALTGGLTLFVYIQVVLRERMLPVVIVLVVCAAAANAIWSIRHPGANYTRYSAGGTPIMVIRGVGAGLDPNASAVLLLLGVGAACAGLLRFRGFARLACGAAALVCTAGVASTGSRGGAIGLVLITAGTAVRALHHRKDRGLSPGAMLLALGAAAMLPYITYRVFTSNNTLYRFSMVDQASQTRSAIYEAWLHVWLKDLPNFLFGVTGRDPGAAVPSTPPHNSLLELAVHVGAVGCVAIAILAMTSRPRRPSYGVDITFTSLAVLLVAMLIGISADYTPWVALALLVRRRALPADSPVAATQDFVASAAPHPLHLCPSGA